MSLIEEALRRQQEQERQRTVSVPAQPAAPQGPPPLPGASFEPPTPPDAAAFDMSDLPGQKKPSKPTLAIACILALCGLLAGLTYGVWLLRGQPRPPREAAGQPPPPSPPPAVTVAGYTSAAPAAVSDPATPPPETTGVAVAAVSIPEPLTGTTSQVTGELPAKPAAEVASAVRETPAAPAAVPPPPAPWPVFTLKGRVAFGKSYAIIMGDGQILEVGDRTTSGIRLESATQDRVRLSFKSQTRDYRLQAGTFVLLPPIEPGS